MDLNIEDVSKLTDDQLFSTMKKCGLNVGPITGTTRSLYEKKLRNFLEGKGNVTISAPSSTKSNASTVADENKPVSKEPVALSKSTIIMPKQTAAQEKTKAPEASLKAASSIPVREKSRERPKTQTVAQPEPMPVKNDILKDTINRVSHTEEVRSTTVMTERPAAFLSKPAPASTFIRSEEAIRQEKILSTQAFNKPVQPSTTTLAYAASTITTTMMPERTQIIEKPKLPQPTFASSTSPFSDDLGAGFTNPLRNYDSPSLFREKDRDFDRNNFLSGTKSSNFATSTLRRNEPIPTPIKDKFAERLNNYGLLKADANEPIAAGGIPLQTPLRNRVVNPDKTPIRNDGVQTKQPTPAKAIKVDDKNKQAQATPVNFKYLIIAVIATIIVYLIAIQFQSNPVNPVEI